jgi:hypothetical protein
MKGKQDNHKFDDNMLKTINCTYFRFPRYTFFNFNFSEAADTKEICEKRLN